MTWSQLIHFNIIQIVTAEMLFGFTHDVRKSQHFRRFVVQRGNDEILQRLIETCARVWIDKPFVIVF